MPALVSQGRPDKRCRHTLSRTACLALLAPGGHGRVATTMRAVPIIIPVTFALLGEDVVFNPGSGEGLARAVANSVVAFETDHVGPDGDALWAVHVTGMARTLSCEGSGGSDAHAPVFRLSSELISGSRAAS